MKNRPIYNSDIPVLQAAIEADKFHPGEWKVEDFRGFSEVFEDTHGPVVFVVYGPEGAEVKRLRISTMWVTPDESHRNGRCIVFLVKLAAERARSAGFEELIFKTTHPPLAKFCTRILNFVPIENDEYVLPLERKDEANTNAL
ncbi:MAG: hypothetical protein C5B59_08615 [Bacteroidetes bacterium]|nr:MAG: hypothetical protein C5B59_08615 [Bacteroidota bacterium]